MLRDHGLPAESSPTSIGVAAARGSAHAASDREGSLGALGERSLEDVCLEWKGKVDAVLAEENRDEADRMLKERVRESLGVIGEAVRRYRCEHLALAYNGGKDCLVMLILILASLPSCASPDASLPAAKLSNGLNGTAQAEPPQHDLQRQQQYPSTLQAVYVAPEHPFAEVEAFVTTSSQEYHLSIKCYTLDMQEAMGRYLAHTPGIQAVFVGTRRADPHGEKLTHFDRTDHGWPDFMRVHPVIDWHYTEIWAFLRRLDIRVCELYEQGFTSLGDRSDTRRNPALAVEAEGDEVTFRPAWDLLDEGKERLGRGR